MSGQNNEIIGKVISTENTPNTSECFFLVLGEVKKGQYVIIRNDDLSYIALVNELFSANKYFERPETVMDYEKVIDISSHFPTDEWDYTIANCRIFGIFDNEKKSLERAFIPPKPGNYVTQIDEELLKKFLGFVEDGLNLGTLNNHNVNVKVDLNRLLQKHLAILAMSGAGKSYLTSIIIEELLNRKKEHGRIGIVLIDVHGEYKFLKNIYPKNVEVYDAEKFRISLKKINSLLISEWIEGITVPQLREFENILNEFKKNAKIEMKPFGLTDIEQKVLELEAKTQKKEIKNLYQLIKNLKSLKLFAFSEKPLLKDIIKPGKLIIFDFSNLTNERTKQIIVHYICLNLFKLRKKNSICPFLLIIEEAHNFAKEKAHKYISIPKSAIETIAREGRKFGASLLLISQRPVKLSTTALSQCNTHIIMRISNPFDQRHIEESAEGIDQYVINSLPNLHVGEAIIVGEATNYPVMFKVRKRNYENKKTEISLKELAIKFEESLEQNKKDVEAFI